MKQYSYFVTYTIVTILFSLPLNAQSIKVFILAGQSNMQGHGEIDPVTTNGTLSNFIVNDVSGVFDYTQNSDGSWATRDDVWVRYDHENGDLLTDVLKVGYGGSTAQIGPELGFGHLLGTYSDDKVLIIKTCWGGTSLAVDFRPPSSGGTVGPYYNQMLADVATAIDNISTEFPDYDGEEIEIAGLCWFQGWNDGEETAYLTEYEENMKNLISDVRTDLNLPELPVVIGLTGNGGYDIDPGDLWVRNLQTILVPAQIAAAEYTGHSNVIYAETRDFWREGSLSPEPTFVHHWNNNAESYLRIGHELGLKMMELLDATLAVPDFHETAITMFPCPTKDHFQLKGITSSVNLNLLSPSGKVLKSLKDISELEEVDLSSFAQGFYFVEILNRENVRIGVKKMIKR